MRKFITAIIIVVLAAIAIVVPNVASAEGTTNGPDWAVVNNTTYLVCGSCGAYTQTLYPVRNMQDTGFAYICDECLHTMQENATL